jgi:hypothetical protein
MVDPTRPLPDPPSARAVRAIVWLHQALQRLAWRIVPPEAHALDLAFSAAKTHALRAAIRVGLFDQLDATPWCTSAELARALALDPGATHRFLRALATLELVRVDRAGRFANTRTGRVCCKREGAVGPFVEYFATDANLAAWGAAEDAVRTGSAAFSSVHGRSVWDHFDAHPEELACFAEAMAFLTRADAAAVAAAYPFAALGDLCDVGGGRAALAAEILVRHPQLRITVLDRPGVLPHAARHLADRGVASRARLVPGDFFAEVPPDHAAYLLKTVLHDWDDPRSLQILRRVRAACRPGARLLVVEQRQDPLELGPTAVADLQMLVVCDGGRERSQAEFRSLFDAAGFRFLRAWPTGSLLWVFEGQAR